MDDNGKSMNFENEYIPKHASNFKSFDGIEDSSDRKGKVKKTVTVKRKRRRAKKWVWVLLLIIFVSVFSISAVKIFLWANDNNETSKIVDNIEANTEIIEKEDDENTQLVNQDEDETSDYWYYITFPLIDVDFTNLKNELEKNDGREPNLVLTVSNLRYSENDQYYVVVLLTKMSNGWIEWK